jgi:hypothetical protein
MAHLIQTLRRLGVKIIVALLRMFARPAPSGWQRSARANTLRRT